MYNIKSELFCKPWTQAIMMYHVGSSIVANVPLSWRWVNYGEGYACVGGRRYMINLCTFSQFCFELKTALKNCLNKQTIIIIMKCGPSYKDI